VRLACLLLGLLLSAGVAAQEKDLQSKKTAAKKSAAKKQLAHKKPTPEQIRKFNELQKKQ